MKINFLIVIVILVWMSMVGCSNISNNDYINDLSNEVVRCFDEKDVEGLEKLFCENSRNSNDLKVQIEEAFERTHK